MSYRRSKLHWPILVVAMLVSTSAFATIVQRMELQQLVTTADSIVQGRVESVEARYEERTIYTYISLVVDDPIKGDRRRTVVLRQMGGRIGAKTLWIAGMPQFNPGDQVIVFLRNRQDGTFDVIGLNQGKYDIVNDYAVANVAGISILDPKTGLISEKGFVDKVPLETFKTKIRELMR
jgi:hypothetical protein